MQKTALLLISLFLPFLLAAAPKHYLILNSVNDTDEAFREIAEQFGSANGKEVSVGAGIIISYLHETRQTAERRLRNYMALSEKYDIPIVIQLDGEQWWSKRPELWNWWDKSKPGYHPKNRKNVEWTDWTPDAAIKIGWINWGMQIRMLPTPNLMSPDYRKACRKEMKYLVPIVAEWYKNLPDDKKYLFVALKVGWESAIGMNNFYPPNGNSYLDKPYKDDPQFVKDPDILPGRGMQPIGYAAVKTAGIARSGELTEQMLTEVIRRHLTDLSKQAHKLGIPREKLFTHCGGWSEGETLYSAALNEYSCPGWSFYSFASDPRQDKTAMEQVSRSNAPYWGAVEWLYMGDNTVQGWKSAIEHTLFDANARYLNIYNWGGIRYNDAAKTAIRQVVGKIDSLTLQKR